MPIVKLENIYPLLSGIIVFLLLLWGEIDFSLETLRQLSNAFFVLFSISCGFISTSLSIFFTLQDRRVIKSLKTSNVFYEIISYHWKAIIWCFFALFLAFLIAIFPELKVFDLPLGYFMCAFGFSAVLAIYRVISLFMRVLMLDKSSK